jgi:hypothetical protein
MLIKYCGTFDLLGHRVVQWAVTTYTNACRRYRQPLAKETTGNPAATAPRRMTPEDFTKAHVPGIPICP